MVHFDAAHRAIQYPQDRRFRVWIKPAVIVGVIVAVLIPLIIAWTQFAFFGLPYIPPVPQYNPQTAIGPHGFPLWIRYTHFFNFLFITMLMRSGLSILMDHPRLYFNNGCTPGTEWIRFTPLRVPKDRIWTAKDDARYISPLVATPGYRHTVGVARSWHFIDVYGFVITGFIFVALLFATEQWRRLVPTSGMVVVQAWNVFVHYASFHLPPEPNGFYGYNALQQIAYFSTVFVFSPLQILTGLAMSPALVNRFAWFPKLFGGRQGARSVHFVLFLCFLAFLVVHITLVVMTGFARNMNHIVMGTDDLRPWGMVWGFVGIAIVVLYWVAAQYVSWHFPRFLQHAQEAVSVPLLLATLDRFRPRRNYRPSDISPHFWPNGKMPKRADWNELAAHDFRDYRLHVGGLVERPVTLSLADLAQLGEEETITMHHCIQGWSGIAKWGGVSFKTVIDLVKPRPEAKRVAFFSYGEALYGGQYYDTQLIEDALKPECMLALDMNGAPLPLEYGAPLRLRVENQLGYKMVKWIERIEFIASDKVLGKGEGGSNEDEEYFDLLPNI